jgi:hypothetical protein
MIFGSAGYFLSEASDEVLPGLGRIVTLHHRSSTQESNCLH